MAPGEACPLVFIRELSVRQKTLNRLLPFRPRSLSLLRGTPESPGEPSAGPSRRQWHSAGTSNPYADFRAAFLQLSGRSPFNRPAVSAVQFPAASSPPRLSSSANHTPVATFILQFSRQRHSLSLMTWDLPCRLSSYQPTATSSVFGLEHPMSLEYPPASL
jgi:hypothetical protein